MSEKTPSAPKILDIDEETLKDVNNISEEERRQITREIDAIMKSEDSSLGPSGPNASPIKKGIGFPLLLNSLLIVFFAATIIGARYYYQQQTKDDLEENRALSQSSLSLAQLIIRENRLRLQQSQSELERIQIELESLGKENANLENVASQKTAEFERRVASEIEARRRELLAELSASEANAVDQEARRREIEANLQAELAQRMQRFRAEQQATLDLQTQEYQSQLTSLQQEFAKKQEQIESLTDEISNKAEEVVVIQEREKIVEVIVEDENTQNELRILKQANLEKEQELRRYTAITTNINTLINANRLTTAGGQIDLARNSILASAYADSQELRAILGSLNTLNLVLETLQDRSESSSEDIASVQANLGLQTREAQEFKEQYEDQLKITENLQSQKREFEKTVSDLRERLRVANANASNNSTSSQNTANQELVSRTLLIERENDIKRLEREKNELNSANRRFVRQLEAQQNGFEIEKQKLEDQLGQLNQEIVAINDRQLRVNRNLSSNISTIAAYYSTTKQGNEDSDGLKRLREITSSDEVFRSIAEVIARTLGVPSDL